MSRRSFERDRVGPEVGGRGVEKGPEEVGVGRGRHEAPTVDGTLPVSPVVRDDPGGSVGEVRPSRLWDRLPLGTPHLPCSDVGEFTFSLSCRRASGSCLDD